MGAGHNYTTRILFFCVKLNLKPSARCHGIRYRTLRAGKAGAAGSGRSVSSLPHTASPANGGGQKAGLPRDPLHSRVKTWRSFWRM